MMKQVKNFIVVLFSISLIACQSHHITEKKIESTLPLYADNAFLKPETFLLETEQDIFMLDDEMLTMVNSKLHSVHDPRKKAIRLLKHIFSQNNIALSYASNANVTARDAYHNKTANCMSLTIMAYALANEAGLDVKFQEIEIPEYWVRNGQYNLLTGHVNLLLSARKHSDKKIVYGSDSVVIDFDPFVRKQTFPKKFIGKNTVISMFYNNKGGQALVRGDFDIAYQYFKGATLADPYFSPAWGNLGVLYRLTKHNRLAEQTYRHAILVNEKNLTTLGNLAILLKDKKEFKEANAIENSLHKKRNKNPYYHMVLADEAYFRRDYRHAVVEFKKALKLNDKIHELYFGLAKTYYKMDKIASARSMMRKAIRLNKTQSIETQYIAKLNFLNAYQPN